MENFINSISKNLSRIIKIMLAIVAVIVTIIAFNFGSSKYVLQTSKGVSISLNQYVIETSEMVTNIIPQEDMKVQLAINSAKSCVIVQYRLGAVGEWAEYAEPIVVDSRNYSKCKICINN